MKEAELTVKLASSVKHVWEKKHSLEQPDLL